MGLRPQTLYGIADSPIGLAAYILDHDARSYALIARVFEGEPEGLSRDDVLDNITITWLTNTALSGARLYWENWGKLGYFNVKGVKIPVAVSVFPDELYPAPRSWAEQAFPKLVHYNRVPKGGHFAAWEQPALFCSGGEGGVQAGETGRPRRGAGRRLAATAKTGVPRSEDRQSFALRVAGLAAATSGLFKGEAPFAHEAQAGRADRGVVAAAAALLDLGEGGLERQARGGRAGG